MWLVGSGLRQHPSGQRSKAARARGQAPGAGHAGADLDVFLGGIWKAFSLDILDICTVYTVYIYMYIIYIYAVGHSRIYFFGAPRWMPDRSRLYRSRTNIPLNMPTWAWAEQLHAPAQCLKARSRLCRFRTNTPLKHTNMSVSSTAAPSPLNTWQPDHVYAAF